MSKKKRIDPIPEEFTSYEEAAEFWDAHDTTAYPDAFRAVSLLRHKLRITERMRPKREHC